MSADRRLLTAGLADTPSAVTSRLGRCWVGPPSVAAAPAAGGGTNTPAWSSGWAGDHLSGARVRGYVVAGEARAVARARPETRNHTLFRAAASLGELLGAGVLEEDAATSALLAAASAHLGVEGSPWARPGGRSATGCSEDGATRAA